MKAAVVRSYDSPLTIEDVPTPVPGPGEVRIRVEAAGLCHTDIHAAYGDWPVKPKLPLIPGHEGVGLVDALGPGVAGIGEGERVVVPWVSYACGRCEHCASGWETLCRSQRNSGYDTDGSYAEYQTADVRFVAKVPSGIDPFEAAPLTCAGVAAYKAVKISRTRPTDLVAVFGVGGVGHMALQYAQVAGAAAVAVDVVDDKLQLAKDLGAQHLVNAGQTDPAAAVQALGGADAAIFCATSPTPAEQAFRALKRGGKLIMLGVPADNQLHLPIHELVFRGITVRGSVAGTRRDLAEVFELHAQGRTRVVHERRSLDQVNEAFDDVLAGRVAARIVFGPASG